MSETNEALISLDPLKLKSELNISKAKESNASAARTAVASSKALCVAGRPLRRSSSSMHGKSS
jgi:hypothetical protein